MITETLTINEYGQVTLPVWFFEKTLAKKGSSLTMVFDENNKSFQFLSFDDDKKDEPKKAVTSGFNMVKTNLKASDLDIDVAQFAKDRNIL